MNHGLDLAKDSLCDPRFEYFLLTPRFQNFGYVLVPVLMPVCAGSRMEGGFLFCLPVRSTLVGEPGHTPLSCGGPFLRSLWDAL